MASKAVALLDTSMSPFGKRCRIALAEKRVEYEYKEEILAEKSELLLTSNPVHKKIPVLLHDGKPVCKSLIIVQYIDEVWPGDAPLLPADPYARAQARFWADYIGNKVFDSGAKLWELKGQAHEQAQKEFIKILKVRCSRGSSATRSSLPGRHSASLTSLVPFSSWFYTYEQYASFSIERECPKPVAWSKRCMERESVAKSLTEPEKAYDFVVLLKKRLGME